ncbi:hypothetical protein FOXG_07208 [Fusarium oxysporum f. sp. lycopersici 4287]|uniref:Uncharacterized protein n=2 Tax=Fusarium oxysporum TaxID=5507 RepID=A0A0J9V055_FUSO4|nr:hypothetical protein FOXG_06618 [Fusarium oxysporum f. sp. lycopersici 4287]XP_018242629.1 hypothetical protein FOXG_06640 [Fusarium oxysporum f. sp. lycopersici 4287]XP_018244562.1 hypothetical protein FOXG_07208 [Fusarium oxysporum f. sp. lycopersici 4287]KAJ9419388.1 hypothetical protein QL093DRAFT_2101456 [Fusarium oxysporum]KNB04553.1 hypothetical protein FOXG_06618 [Fusarium oxysporum f. sp. lycopersici 4287]KNB04584.1 hypothetical protein FOXG_06640 [Fusarium oxysporum f. sp. lycoper
MKFSTARATLVVLAPVLSLAKGKKLDSVSFQADIKTDKSSSATNHYMCTAQLTITGLMLNLKVLNDISFDSGSNRALGSPGYSASVDYTYKRASEVKEAKAWKRYFSVISASVDYVSLKVEDKPIHIHGLTYSPSTSVEGITAEIALGLEGAAGCDASSYRGLDVKGKGTLPRTLDSARHPCYLV